MFVTILNNIQNEKLDNLKAKTGHLRVLEVGVGSLYLVEIYAKDKIARGFGKTRDEAIECAIAHS